MISDDVILDGFSGLARLFPLPNLVLFPHVVQGLHLFEPRYRQLAADSIADDQLFAMATIDPDWDGSGLPALAEFCCLGHIQQYEKLPDGRFQMRLRGLRRARILGEVESNKLYRIARVELIDEGRPDDVNALIAARKRLRESVLARIDPASDTYRQLGELFSSETPLGQLVDLLAYALPITTQLKCRILATPDVWERVEQLISELGGPPAARMHRVFPPAFSDN
jgi:Lon protease-like protein